MKLALVSSAADQLTQFTEERTELRSQVQSIKGIVETGNQIGLRDIQQNLRNIAGSFETSLETLGTHISNIKDAVDAEDAGLVVTVRKLGGTASDLKQRIDTLSSQETEARAQRDEALRGLKTLNETYKSHNTTLGRLISSSQDGSLPKQMQGLASLLNSFDTKYGAQGTIATAEGERLRGFQDVKSSFDTILNQNLRGDAGLPKQVETMSKALDAFDTKYGSEGTVAQSEAQRLKDFNDLKDALRASADTLKQNLEGKQGLPERIRSLESVMSNRDATYGVEGTVSKAEAQRQKDFQGLKDSFDTCSTTLKDSIEGEDGLQKQTQALASSVQAIDTRHGENGTVNRAQDDFLRGARDVNTSISTATSTLQASLNDEGGLVKRVTQLGQEIEKLSVSRQNFESIRGDLHALIGQAPEDVAVVSLREMSASVQSAANDVANKVQEARNLLAQEQPYNSQSAQQLRRRVVELEVSQRVAIVGRVCLMVVVTH